MKPGPGPRMPIMGPLTMGKATFDQRHPSMTRAKERSGAVEHHARRWIRALELPATSAQDHQLPGLAGGGQSRYASGHRDSQGS